MGLLQNYHELEKRDVLGRQEAQERAIDLIYSKRFGEEDLDYFWIHDYEPVMIMHPFVPALEGQNLADYEDPEGFRLFEAFVETSLEEGSGFVEYHWQYYDDEERIEPKMSYVKGFEPWGWILGTGVYIHDVEETVARTRNNILLGSGLIVVVLFVAGYYFVRFNITEPLSRVMEVASGLAKGQLEQDKIEVHSSDELGELAAVFNKLLENLGRMTQQAREIPAFGSFVGSGQNLPAADFLSSEPESAVDDLQELSSAFNVMTSSLKRTTSFLRGIINSMEEMLVVLGPEGSIREVNKTTCETLGYSEKELKEKPLQFIVNGIEEINLRKVLERENYRQREEELETKTGVCIPVLISISELELPGDKNNYVCVVTDITERKK